MSDVRFSDTDVRTYPQLTEIAINYAVDYAGEWEFMVAARSLAQQTGTLPTATARAVLNAMRADPKVVMSLPELCDLEPLPKFQRVLREERIVQLDQKEEDYKIVVETHRYPFNVEIKWNMDYYLATHKQATAAHLLSHERSHVVYYPMWNKTNYASLKHRYMVNLKSECGVHLATGHLFSTPLERYICRACNSAREDRQNYYE